MKIPYLRSGISSAVGAGLASMMALRFQKTQDENRLFLEYRPEIALSLGKPAEEVSAKEWEHFKAQNPLLRQADEAMRFSAKDWGVILLSAFSGGFLASESAARLVSKRNEGSLKADGSKIAGSVSGMLGGALIGSQLRKVVYDHSIEGKLANTAHGLLMEVKEKLLAGEKVAPSDVMALQVSLNPKLIAPHILMRGNAEQEAKLAAEYPELMQQNRALAEALNEGRIRPHQLIFAMGKEGRWDVAQVLKNKESQKPDIPLRIADMPAKEKAWGADEQARKVQQKEPAGMAM